MSANRMTLANLSHGRLAHPQRILCYGPEGVGKSTYGANAPAPIFIGAENGTAHLDVSRFPQPETWSEIGEAIRALRSDVHEFKTLVIDTVDWVEPLVHKAVCESKGVDGIESLDYGKGYVWALDYWRRFLNALDVLRDVRSMNIVLLGHAQVKRHINPEGPDYDRYTLKLHEKAGALLKEWCDHVLFANHKISITKDGRKAKGKDAGRVLYTTRRAAFDAKNRAGLPDELPLSWRAFQEALVAGPVKPEEDAA